MQKLFITIALAVIALALGTATITTTTMQIQPAYSQASHCVDRGLGFTSCTTNGRNPSASTCDPFIGCESRDLTHKQAAQGLHRQNQLCGKGLLECSIGNPDVNVP